jgi:uncharacterized protein
MSRADLRRRRKADEQAVKPGLDVVHRSADQLVSLMRILHLDLQECRQAGSIEQLGSRLFAVSEATARRLAGVKLACRRGCSFCCNGWVGAAAPEIFLVTRHIAKSRASEGRTNEGRANDYIAAIAAAHTMTNGKTFQERRGMRVQCPMLRDGACSVYASRPIVCRTATSFDASICERSYGKIGEAIPQSSGFLAMRDGLCLALSGALKRCGLPHCGYEMQEALKVALATSGAEARWLGGEDIFKNVQRDGGKSGEMMDSDPQFQAIYNAAFAA